MYNKGASLRIPERAPFLKRKQVVFLSFVILAINPGSTSTKAGLFDGAQALWTETVRHDPAEIAKFPSVSAQYDYRLEAIRKILREKGCDLGALSAVVGRGGIIDPIPGGTYAVDDFLRERLLSGKPWEHASNLGGVLARGIADPLKVPAYIVDPVSADEVMDIARVTGLPQVPRIVLNHNLNAKAVTRRAARDLGVDFLQKNFILVHLGGGFTICAIQGGRIIDFDSGSDTGPFSPERAGALPAIPAVELCFSGDYDERSFKKQIAGRSGMMAWFGTSDMREIARRASEGDAQVNLVRDAMIYRIGCSVGAMAAALKGCVEAVVFTGGIAYDSSLIAAVEGWVGWIAPCLVYPGEDEMKALAEGALRVLQGEEKAKDYRSSVMIRSA